MFFGSLILASLLAGPSCGDPPAPAQEKIPVLIVSGANNHDWEWTTPSLRSILEESGRFQVDVTRKPGEDLAKAGKLAGYRAIVLDYNGPRWGESAESQFLEAVRTGTGVSVIHAANNAFTGWKEYEELVALCWRQGTGHGRFHRFQVSVTDRDHPITRDMPDLIAHPDELYHKLVHMHGTDYRVLASAFSDPETGGTGRDEPMVIVKNYGQGRVFHTPLGHVWKNNMRSRNSHRDPQFRDLVVRGTEWAATGKVTGSYSGANQLTQAERAAGWELLYDGKTSSAWRGYKRPAFPEKGWDVANGALYHIAGGGGGDLITIDPYRDFDLRFDWKVAPKANSGVMFRVTETNGPTWHTGPEYQVLDDSGHDVKSTDSISAGGLYALVDPQGKSLRETGEYNQARILLHDNQLEHWLNGKKILGAELGSADWKRRVEASKFKAYSGFGNQPEGHIALQDHGDAVWYRNLKIRRLPPKPAGKEIVLFDGQNLDQWEFFQPDGVPLEQVWSIDEQGVLVCKGKPAGYLHTKQDYENFILHLDWRWSPETKKGGNSGVLIRVIEEHKVWPKSIEYQLHSGSAGDFWQIGNYPMKTDPARTRGRNTKHTHRNEHPVGEWNHCELIASGGWIQCKVNGQVVNQATEALRTAGKIALQSEGTEIHFKNVRLIPLPD